MNMYFSILWRNTNWLLEAQIVLKLKTIKNKLQSANSAILKISKSQKEILGFPNSKKNNQIALVS